MLSCNILSSIPERLARTLKHHCGYFDKIRVVITDTRNKDLDAICDRYPNIERYYWEYDLQSRIINYIYTLLGSNEWAAILDDDELCSQQLMDNFYPIIKRCQLDNLVGVVIPRIDEINYELDKDLHVVEMSQNKWEYDRFIDPALNINPPSYMTKRIFKSSFLPLASGGVHPVHDDWGKCLYVPYPIIHFKRHGEYIEADVWQGFYCALSGEFRFGEISEKLIKAIYDSKIMFTREDLFSHLEKGDISESLKQWMWDNKDHEHPYVFAWFMIYYFKYHPEELPDSFYDERLIKIWVDHNANSYNSEVIGVSLEPKFKKILIDAGITNVHKINQSGE